MKKIIFLLIFHIIVLGFTNQRIIAQSKVSSIGAVTDSVYLTDVAYGEDEKEKMDLFLPAGRNEHTTPIIILIHGGAWNGGNKSQFTPFIPFLQKKWPEVAFVNMNYRLANGTTVTHTEITEDIRRVIDHLMQHRDKYHISDKIALMGASAGGHLAMLYAYKHNKHKRIKAVSNIFGVGDLAQKDWYDSNNPLLGGDLKDMFTRYAGKGWDVPLYKSLSPYYVVTAKNYVPTITFHGTDDKVVPIMQSEQLIEKFKSLGVEYAYYPYPGQGHGFDMLYYLQVVDKTIAFFKKYMESGMAKQ